MVSINRLKSYKPHIDNTGLSSDDFRGTGKTGLIQQIENDNKFLGFRQILRGAVKVCIQTFC